MTNWKTRPYLGSRIEIHFTLTLLSVFHCHLDCTPALAPWNSYTSDIANRKQYYLCRRDVLLVVPRGEAPGEYRRIGAGDMTVWLGNNQVMRKHEDYFYDAKLVDIVSV
ncbi:hypothetical protein K402DRAFT_245049 [Aulographum hederae CBS 113979]|uniref:Uncharacterized protein n=1 Tax=Aulographum hederae CBS 113979 TaxID=1176131 RepID=A0A6G1HA06_9PEZI|nr:hypothetical protein K402DRAFT_245049 [Aulographum hederae CBS 113979]